MENKPNIITKENELFGQVRFAYIDGELYAVGIDVAEALGYAYPSSTVSTKCKGVIKMIIPTNGENQTSPKNPKETQPLYYEDKFADLLKKLGI